MLEKFFVTLTFEQFSVQDDSTASSPKATGNVNKSKIEASKQK